MGVKRLVAIAISVTALVAPVGLWAQHGGGGHSSGGGHSFSGAHAAGGFSGFHSSQAPVSRPNSGWSGFSTARQSSGAWRGFTTRRGPIGGRPYPGRGNRYYGYGFGPYVYNPYWYGYGFYPYIPSSMSYAGFPDDYQSQGAQPEDYGAPPTEAENELEDQVQQLGDEVAQLRAGQGYPPGPGYGPGYPGPAYGAPGPSASESQLSTVLVYRDGHQMEVQNYAIYSKTVWVFGDQITRKIALSDLDVAKTKQLNDQRGVEFDVPESN